MISGLSSFVGAYDRAYEVLGTAEASFDHIAIRLLSH
jgi:hypothetical protein